MMASPSPESAPDNDMMTSFSNPNYTLSDPDALNSNLPASTEFFDNDNLYEDPDLMDTSTSKTNSSSKRRKKYSGMDLESMGVDLADGSLMVHNELRSPDSVGSSDSEHNSAGSSAATSPAEKTTSIVEVEHTANNTDDDEADTYAQVKPTGFLGYYASLELSAKARQEERDAKESEEDEEEEEEEEEEEAEKRPLMTKAQARVASQAAALNKSYDDKTKDINSPDSNDSGIQADVQHVRGPVNNDLYAVVDKAKARAGSGGGGGGGLKQKEQQAGSPEAGEDQTDQADDQEDPEPPLPAGWQKHEDEDGAYYWHIKSGTIQRDPPPPPPAKPRREAAQRSTSSGSEVSSSSDSDGGGAGRDVAAANMAAAPPAHTSSTSSPPQTEPAGRTPGARRSPGRARTHHDDPAIKSRKEKPSSPADSESDPDDKRIRFAVRSLGWVRIAEEDLTPERSSKAVNKCIVDLSLGRNDINDVVGRWGDGKDLFMDLDSEHLTLTDPQDMSILNVQPIQSIRVWGVGRDNGRDFAYVARDRMTRKHMCHVFRCDTPARQIANTLRDICKQIMVERTLQQQQQHLSEAQGGLHKMAISRPNNLPDLNKSGTDHNGQKLTFQNLYKNTSFPTPMEEPKKVLRCHYLGAMHVTSASGIQTLNAACSKAYSRVPPEKWVFVSVGVAPSTITITEHGSDNILAECRVRFLSFMGIAMRNVKMCAFIMHTAQDMFLCHIFHCEPSAGALCKTIEAACKLRYQKCLDAHPQTPGESKKSTQPAQKQGLGASIKSVFGSIKGRKTKDKEKS